MRSTDLGRVSYSAHVPGGKEDGQTSERSLLDLPQPYRPLHLLLSTGVFQVMQKPWASHGARVKTMPDLCR